MMKLTNESLQYFGLGIGKDKKKISISMQPVQSARIPLAECLNGFFTGWLDPNWSTLFIQSFIFGRKVSACISIKEPWWIFLLNFSTPFQLVGSRPIGRLFLSNPFIFGPKVSACISIRSHGGSPYWISWHPSNILRLSLTSFMIRQANCAALDTKPAWP